MMYCHICEKDIECTAVEFSNRHLRVKHNISPREYYDLYIKEVNEGICSECGGDTRYVNISNGYRKYCSNKCSNNSKSVKSKKRNTLISNYGVDVPLKSDVIRNKVIKTNIDKYGTEWGLQSDIIKNKCKVSNKLKYGVDNVFQSDEVKSKISDTVKSKYGVDNVSKVPEMRAKASDTMEERYGVRHALKNSDLLNKSKETLYKNYGVQSPLHSEVIKSRVETTNLDRYGYKSVFQNEHVKAKIKKAVNDKYGTDHPMQSDVVKHKLRRTARMMYWLTYLHRMAIKNLTPMFTEEDYIHETEFDVKCGYCDKIFSTHETNPQRISCGCKKFSSIGERELRDYIIEISEHEVKSNVTFSGKRRYELDVYIPELNIGFEYHGLYWHSDIHVDKHYHKNKYNFFHNRGIRVIQIFENEWINSKDIVKSIITNILGKSKSIYARKCTIESLTTKQYKQFVEINHIQGYVPSSIRLGLFLDGKLVALMSFAKSRYDKSCGYELMRYCSLLNASVVGGFSKLLMHFQKTYECKHLVSYCDLRYFDGSGYIKNGFKYVSTTNPNYFYFKQNSLVLESRVKYQKHKLSKKLNIFDESLSEYDNMLNNKYLRIFDAGNLKLLKDFTS